jgi:YVTN family beta-propeller protein
LLTGEIFLQYRRKLLGSVLAGTLGALALSTGIAHADTIATLPINGFYQVVADTAHNQLFFSQGSISDDDIVVTNLTGQEVATIPSQDGVMGIAMSPDGSTLYAALASDDAVTAINTSTLAVTATYPLPAGDTPQDVAVQSGKVWVSYTGVGGSGAIGDIDLTASPPAFEAQAAMGNWSSAPQLAADPQDTGVLVAALSATSPASVASYDVAVDPVTVRAQNLNTFGNCDNEGDLAVIPGGADFVLACAWPYSAYEYSTADLSQQEIYSATAYPDAVAVAPNGTVAAGVSSASDAPDLYVYQPGASSPEATYQFESANGSNAPDISDRGTAWSADGSELYVVLQPSQTPGGPYTLHVVTPGLTSSALTVTGPSSVPVGEAVSATGELTLGSGTVPPGTIVTVTRTEAGGSPAPLNPVQVSSNGTFSLSDTPTAIGTYTYAFGYPGDASVAPASASYSVSVVPDSSTLSLTGPTSATIGKGVTLTGSLKVQGHSSVPPSTTVTVTRTGTGGTKKFNAVKPSLNGTFSLSDTQLSIGSYTYTASYSGTSTVTPSTATHKLSVTAIAPSLSVTTGAVTFAYDSTIHVTAHLGTTATNRTVSIYAQPTGGAKKLLKTGKVSSSGTLTVSYVAAHSTTFSEVFSGDAKYAAKTVTHTVTVSAKVSPTISGYYASKKIGSQTYRLYHDTAHLNVAVTVAPDKSGQCVELQIQEFFEGSWQTSQITSCGTLNSSSKVSGFLRLSSGIRFLQFRIRADYVRSSGDTSNLSTDSGWLYFMVEN